jgi:hypothetical protein
MGASPGGVSARIGIGAVCLFSAINREEYQKMAQFQGWMRR